MGEKFQQFTDLFAFDLDGTLVHNQEDGTRSISRVLIDAVEKISTRAHFTIATGRGFRSARRDLIHLPSCPYVVVNNGLVIKDFEGKTVMRHQMDFSAGISIAKLIVESGGFPFFVADAFEEKLDLVFPKTSVEGSEFVHRFFERAKGYLSMIEAFSEIGSVCGTTPLLEVATVGSYLELLRIQSSIQPLLPPPYRSVVVKNIGLENCSALEVSSIATSKWSGIEFVKEKLGASRVIAIGDDENDLEMIESADIGLAMSHAEPHIRSKAHRELDGPKELALFLKEFYS